MSKQLTIVQMNDSHAYLDLHQELFWEGSRTAYRPSGGYARIATLVKRARKESKGACLFCDCGDTLHGSYLALKTQGSALVPILNALGLDAMTAHWEFAYGPKTFYQRTLELNYPMLAVNIYDKQSRQLIYKPYFIKEIGGLKAGIIGVASNIVDKTMPPHFSEGIYFTLGKDELPPVIDTLRTKEKVDLIVLVSHLGFPQEMKLLSEVQGIDVCLSGHTHNRLYQPVVNGKTIVMQSGCHGSFLGRLDIEIENRKIVTFRHQLMEVKADIVPDPEVDGLVKNALLPHKAFLSEIVGETSVALDRSMVLGSTMDNFLLQAIRQRTGAEIAFSNGWRYGAPIPRGKITMNDLYNIIPMDPPISITELSGEEIAAMLEENLERTFSSDPYKQMGGYLKRCLGLTVYFKIENPEGHRIQKIYFGNREIEKDRYYTAAFVTPQGVGQKYGRNRQTTSWHSIDALKTYLAVHSPLKIESSGNFIAV